MKPTTYLDVVERAKRIYVAATVHSESLERLRQMTNELSEEIDKAEEWGDLIDGRIAAHGCYEDD